MVFLANSVSMWKVPIKTQNNREIPKGYLEWSFVGRYKGFRESEEKVTLRDCRKILRILYHLVSIGKGLRLW